MSTVPGPRVTREPFRTSWWMANPHLQTILPAFRRVVVPARLRMTIGTPDGDFLDLDWLGDKGSGLVVLLHGLAGSSKSAYILGLQKALVNVEFRTVAMNFRGCSGRPNDRANVYHSGETGVIDQVVGRIRNKEPKIPVAAVGFSLGGNVLLKWLGEKAEKCNLFAAVSVSVPFQLDRCADRMDRGVSRVYRNYLLGRLRRYMAEKLQHLEARRLDEEAGRITALGDLSGIRSFWDYDDRVIAPLYGFKDALDYYEQSSSRSSLASIRVPTLLLQSIDDPFMTPETVPTSEELSSRVILEASPSGGHVGFVSGAVPGTHHYWLEQRIPEFLTAQL